MHRSPSTHTLSAAIAAIDARLAHVLGADLHWRANATTCLGTALLAMLLGITWTVVVSQETASAEPNTAVFTTFVFLFVHAIVFLACLVSERDSWC